MPHDALIRSCNRLSSALACSTNPARSEGESPFCLRNPSDKATSSAGSIRPQASRTASHSKALRTWQTSRTSRGPTRRTTAPRSAIGR